jgi:hypothetical protein
MDSLFDEKPRELRIVAGCLPANADFAAFRATDGNRLRNHILHGRVPFVEDRGDDLAVTVDSRE